MNLVVHFIVLLQFDLQVRKYVEKGRYFLRTRTFLASDSYGFSRLYYIKAIATLILIDPRSYIE